MHLINIKTKRMLANDLIFIKINMIVIWITFHSYL